MILFMARIRRKKIVVDATNEPVGRLASRLAQWLMGKQHTNYVPYQDRGDRVVVEHVAKLRFSGKKLAQKIYRHHSMHPGGLKEIPARHLMRLKPEMVLRLAVQKMLPKNKFRTDRLRRLSFKP